MTETEWLASEDPAAMLQHLQYEWVADAAHPESNNVPRERPLISDRKLRLFACACCRTVSHLLTDERSRRAVEVAERFADGKESRNDLSRAASAAGDVMDSLFYRDLPFGLAGACLNLGWSDANRDTSASAIVRAVLEHMAGQQLADLMRDIVGNPFRPVPRHRLYRTGDPDAPSVIKDRNGSVVLDLCRDCGKGESELSGPCFYITPTVLDLARAAYEIRDRKCLACNRWTDCKWCDNTRRLPQANGWLDNERLAVLSDAMEEAGCPTHVECPQCGGLGVIKTTISGLPGEYTCADCKPPGLWYEGTGKAPHPLIAHLRSPGPHVRGCWALDLILGKE